MKTAAELKTISETNAATLETRIAQGVEGMSAVLEEKASRGLRVASFELTEEFSEMAFAKMLATQLSTFGYNVAVDVTRSFNGQKMVRNLVVEW